MIRSVIFDFNGVLADDDPIHMRAFREVAREEGISFSDEEYLDRYLPLNDRDCFTVLWESSRRTLTPTMLQSLIERKSVHYFRAIAEKPVLFAGAEAAIRAAARCGTVAIASGASMGEIQHILGQADLLSCFSAIVAAEDVTHGKPHPEPFSLAYTQLRLKTPDLKPEECIAVEDSVGGIQSAHAAGLPCLGIAHSYEADRLTAVHAEWVIDSIADFSAWLNRRMIEESTA